MLLYCTLLVFLASVIVVLNGQDLCNRYKRDGCKEAIASIQRELIDNQGLVHCTLASHTEPQCSGMWDEDMMFFKFGLSNHYERLAKESTHTTNLLSSKVLNSNIGEVVWELDLTIDMRCHHSWPQTRYHRIADCLAFMIPAVVAYFKELGRKSVDRWKVGLLVDESSEALCGSLSAVADHNAGLISELSVDYDTCLFSEFRSVILFGSKSSALHCIKTSLFNTSAHWYKLQKLTFVHSKEVLWLEEQKNPRTRNSGRDGAAGAVHPLLPQYAKHFSLLMQSWACSFCLFPPKYRYESYVLPELGHGSQKRDVLLIQRRASTQSDDIVTFIRSQGEVLGFEVLEELDTSDSLCATVALWKAALVIVSLYGAGMENIVLAADVSQSNTLFVEVSTSNSSSVSGLPLGIHYKFLHVPTILGPHQCERNRPEISDQHKMMLAEWITKHFSQFK